MKFPDSAFWDFSINFYQRPNVEESCLTLQDEFSLNVNLILFCYWLSIEKQQVLSRDQWSVLLNASLPWEEIIKPLRQSRRMITQSTIAWPNDFKQETKKAVAEIEINTEHMQQLSIEQAWQKMNCTVVEINSQEIINDNLRNYLPATDSKFSINDISNETSQLLKASIAYNENNQTMAL